MFPDPTIVAGRPKQVGPDGGVLVGVSVAVEVGVEVSVGVGVDVSVGVGVEVFDPSTSNVLMAALLVHDLHTGGGPRHEHPWQDEAYAAAHGGLWRTTFAPRSALGLAAVLGMGAARG